MLLAILTGSKGRVIAFEAFPANADKIIRNVALNKLRDRVDVENVAVSDGRLAKVDLFPGRGAVSFEWNIVGRDVSGNRQPAVTQIAAVSLDTYFDDNIQIDFVKMDIEGAEAQALPSMRGILRRCRPVLVIEFHEEDGWAGRKELDAANYRLYDLNGRIWIDPRPDVGPTYQCLAVPDEQIHAFTPLFGNAVSGSARGKSRTNERCSIDTKEFTRTTNPNRRLEILCRAVKPLRDGTVCRSDPYGRGRAVARGAATRAALDLCCGDGYFASLSQPDGFDVGCDISESALRRAGDLGRYGSLSHVDVARGIPFSDAYFSTIVSNSSLEHVHHIEGAMREIARVLKPGGRLYFTLASDFAYQWWPGSQDALNRYLSYQPVYSHFSLDEWAERLARSRLTVVDHRYYLSKPATQLLLWLDYHVSRATMTFDRTLSRQLVRFMHKMPRPALAWLWRKLFAPFQIVVSDKGGGLLIVAERSADG